MRFPAWELEGLRCGNHQSLKLHEPDLRGTYDSSRRALCKGPASTGTDTACFPKAIESAEDITLTPFHLSVIANQISEDVQRVGLVHLSRMLVQVADPYRLGRNICLSRSEKVRAHNLQLLRELIESVAIEEDVVHLQLVDTLEHVRDRTARVREGGQEKMGLDECWRLGRTQEMTVRNGWML